MRWEDGCNGAVDGEARGVWCTLNDEYWYPFPGMIRMIWESLLLTARNTRLIFSFLPGIGQYLQQDTDLE